MRVRVRVRVRVSHEATDGGCGHRAEEPLAEEPLADEEAVVELLPAPLAMPAAVPAVCAICTPATPAIPAAG